MTVNPLVSRHTGSARLDLIAGDRRDLPLKEHLPFFLLSGEIVAKILVSLPRSTTPLHPAAAGRNL